MDLDFTVIEELAGKEYTQKTAPEPMTQEELLAEIYKTLEDMDSGKAADAMLKAVECIAIKKNNPRLYADVVLTLYKKGLNLRKLSQEAEALAKQEDVTPTKRRFYEFIAMLARHDAEEIEEKL